MFIVSHSKAVFNNDDEHRDFLLLRQDAAWDQERF